MVMPSSERTSPEASLAAAASPSLPTTKSQRVLACVLCQRRKLRCDRQFPCANCTRSHAQCVPAATLPPRQRRRRFPERELLDRLRRYESLLRENSINFEPLHKDTSSLEKEPPDADDDSERPKAAVSRDRSSSPSTTSKSESVYKAKYTTIFKSLYTSLGLIALSQEPLACHEPKGMSTSGRYSQASLTVMQ